MEKEQWTTIPFLVHLGLSEAGLHQLLVIAHIPTLVLDGVYALVSLARFFNILIIDTVPMFH